MRGEYQTIVDIVRESLPLNGRDVKFQYDPFDKKLFMSVNKLSSSKLHAKKRQKKNFRNKVN